MMAGTSLIVALIGFILIAGALLKHLSKVKGYPLNLILIFLGIILGNFKVKGVPLFSPGAPESQGAVTAFITLALILVLFDTGSKIKIGPLFRNFAGPSIFGLMSVFLTILFVALPFKFILGVNWLLAILFGSFLASTDLTILGPVISNIKLKPRVSEYLEIESIINTVISAVLVIVLVNLIGSATKVTGSIIGEGIQTILYNIFVGVGLGVFFGALILWVIRHLTLEEMPQLIMIGSLFGAYAITEMLGASGIATALAVGVVFGNSKYKIPNIVKSFGGELELILVTFVFVILGAIINFSVIKGVLFMALILLALVYAARYLSLKYSNKDFVKYNNFYLLASPRGITCAVLTLKFAELFPNAQMIIGLVFAVILVSSLSLFGITKTIPSRA
jgi:NhaP-type Na+/H+ or K+/H+ antiporter